MLYLLENSTEWRKFLLGIWISQAKNEYIFPDAKSSSKKIMKSTGFFDEMWTDRQLHWQENYVFDVILTLNLWLDYFNSVYIAFYLYHWIMETKWDTLCRRQGHLKCRHAKEFRIPWTAKTANVEVLIIWANNLSIPWSEKLMNILVTGTKQ